MQSFPKRIGKFTIVREIARGGMGIVYEALDDRIGRRVAIKTLRNDHSGDPRFQEELSQRFIRESQVIGALNHPHIVTIYEADEDIGQMYIAMEFIEGGSLQNLLDTKKRISINRSVEICSQVCRALHQVHKRDIIHRDIKPGNILFYDDEIVKLTDFGVARLLDTSTLTEDGQLLGTPQYMSPEQIAGKGVDARSDLFSVAIVLYELLTGQNPFQGTTIVEVLHKIDSATPRQPRSINPSIPQPLEQVLLKALNKKPAIRYQDGRAFATALQVAISANPSQAALGLSAPGKAMGVSHSIDLAHVFHDAKPQDMSIAPHPTAQTALATPPHQNRPLELPPTTPGFTPIGAANQDADIDKDGRNALIRHTIAGDYRKAQSELEMRPNLSHTDKYGKAAIHYATSTYSSDTIAILNDLIRAGANIDQQTRTGHTALMLAAANLNVSAVKILHNSGANLAIRDRLGKTAYDYVPLDAATPEIESLLRPR